MQQLNIYDKQTTYTNDYKYPKVGNRAQYVWTRVEEPRAEPPSLALVRDNETLTTRPSLIAPQGPPCTRVNPEPSVRPHEVMSPAVSLEEMEDPTARGLLVRHTYTTSTGRAGREGALPVSPQQVSARTLETRADPVQPTLITHVAILTY
uniref:(California timema) hypothetical protein n=1 Tax=Timema californicum TaxID=61474 RepID=A0A7R9JLV2_TIMCA|nr:unnamed protein product [Timema californicum]